MKYEFSEQDKKVIGISGFGQKRGYGKKPVILIVDAQKKFIGTDKPILESMEDYPLSIGETAVRAVEKIKGIVDIARERKVPIIYSTSSVPKNEMIFNSFAKKRIKHEVSPNIPADSEEFADLIKPVEGEWIVHKRYSSVFFGTPLVTFLNTLNCDTLIVTGFTTSGCIRAAVVDAASYNYNVAVVEDCVADRFEISHEISLFDMNLKHADVVLSDEVIDYLKKVEE